MPTIPRIRKFFLLRNLSESGGRINRPDNTGNQHHRPYKPRLLNGQAFLLADLIDTGAYGIKHPQTYEEEK